MRPCLRLISLVLVLFISNLLYAQHSFPVHPGEKARYRVMIEMPKSYLSGICILYQDSAEVKGSIFNEFGVSAIDFSYIPYKDKVKLRHVMKMLNKWYIKRVLRKDLLALIHNLKEGIYEYDDLKYKISFRFTPMEEMVIINE